MLKNQKIRGKLMTRFLIVVAMAILVGAFGIFGLQDMRSSIDTMHNQSFNGLYYSARMESIVNSMQAHYLSILLNFEDSAVVQQNSDAIVALEAEFEELYSGYEDTITEGDTEGREAYEQMGVGFHNVLVALGVQMREAAAQGDKAEMQALFDEMNQSGNAVLDIFAAMNNANTTEENAQYERAENTAATLTISLVAILVAAVVIGVLLAMAISRMIVGPTTKLVEAAKKMSVGDMEFKIEVDTKDETGVLAQAFREVAGGVREQVAAIARIADGDYTMTLPVRSENDQMNKALNTMLDSNNTMISEIREAAQQVANGSAQIAGGAQTLATGST